MVVSNIFYVHPYLGKIPILTSIFFRWVETTNQEMSYLQEASTPQLSREKFVDKRPPHVSSVSVWENKPLLEEANLIRNMAFQNFPQKQERILVGWRAAKSNL